VAKKKELKQRGRPPVEIDLETIAKLAHIHATYEQIAGWFNCTKRTIITRMKDPQYLLAYENGKQRGKISLKQLQWRHAQGLDPDGKYIKGSQGAAVNMTKHLSAHWLDERDSAPSATLIQNNNTLALTNASESDLRALESVLARIADASASEGRVIEAGSGSTDPEG
jgi:hypothetical protein